MRRWMIVTLSLVTLLSLGMLVRQSTRYMSLADQARTLESEQETWIKENRKLETSMAVLTNRAWAEAAATSLGLKRAVPSQRLRILIEPGRGP